MRQLLEHRTPETKKTSTKSNQKAIATRGNLMDAPTRTVPVLALACIVVYAALSILLALRMWFVHGKYVHIEFNSEHWTNLGKEHSSGDERSFSGGGWQQLARYGNCRRGSHDFASVIIKSACVQSVQRIWRSRPARGYSSLVGHLSFGNRCAVG